MLLLALLLSVLCTVFDLYLESGHSLNLATQRPWQPQHGAKGAERLPGRQQAVEGPLLTVRRGQGGKASNPDAVPDQRDDTPC